MSDAFASGAAAYKHSFGRPPTLVIDGADFLMSDDKNLDLIKKLITRAKALARPPLAPACAARACSQLRHACWVAIWVP